MATIEKRIVVTPKPRAAAVLREFELLSGRAPSTVLRALLDEAVPTLEQAVLAMREIQLSQDSGQVKAVLARLSNQITDQLTQATDGVQQHLNLDAAMSRKPGAKPKKRAAQVGSGKGGPPSG